MSTALFDILYFAMAGGYVGAAAAACLKKRRTALGFGMVGTVFSLMEVGQIVVETGRPPIYGHFESIVQIVLILGTLGVVQEMTRSPKGSGSISSTASVAWIASALLLIPLFFYPRNVNPDFYMYQYPSVLMFFNFKIIAAALFLFAAVRTIAGLFTKGIERIEHRHLSRNILLLGTVFFLSSECAGSFWLLQWWGDVWHWSKGFLQAAGLFMLIMLSCHIPKNWKHATALHAATTSLPGAVSLYLLLVR